MRRADNRVKERLYYRQNAHWTAAGHAVAADELYDFLAEQGLTRQGLRTDPARRAGRRGRRRQIARSTSARPSPTIGKSSSVVGMK